MTAPELPPYIKTVDAVPVPTRFMRSYICGGDGKAADQRPVMKLRCCDTHTAYPTDRVYLCRRFKQHDR